MSKTAFEDIKAYYAAQDKKALAQGQLPMRSTDVGFWGVSNLDDVQNFFEQHHFPNDTRFLDIGCGDGRVVAVASLYVDTAGVEYDQELAQRGTQALADLNISGTIHARDVREIDLSDYDVLYMYADNNFSHLKEKLLSELRGTLYLYHDTYHPEFLTKKKTTWVGQIPIFAYTAPTKEE